MEAYWCHLWPLRPLLIAAKSFVDEFGYATLVTRQKSIAKQIGILINDTRPQKLGRLSSNKGENKTNRNLLLRLFVAVSTGARHGDCLTAAMYSVFISLLLICLFAHLLCSFLLWGFGSSGSYKKYKCRRVPLKIRLWLLSWFSFSCRTTAPSPPAEPLRSDLTYERAYPFWENSYLKSIQSASKESHSVFTFYHSRFLFKHMLVDATAVVVSNCLSSSWSAFLCIFLRKRNHNCWTVLRLSGRPHSSFVYYNSSPSYLSPPLSPPPPTLPPKERQPTRFRGGSASNSLLAVISIF